MKELNSQDLVVNDNNVYVLDDKLPKLKKARFIKVDINILDQPAATTLVKVFTFLPIPLAIGKMFSNIIVKKLNEALQTNFTKNDLIRLLNASKGLSVDVESDEANIKVKII